MKKLLLIMMVLGVTTAYSQEIRVPNEQRDKYVKEREQRPTVSAEDQKRMDEAAAKRREAAEQQRREQANPRGVSRTNMYFIIQEISTPGKPGKEQVSILMGSGDRPDFDKMDERTAQRVKQSMERSDFKSGLDALNHYTGMGWILENTTVYPANGQTIREYMIKL